MSSLSVTLDQLVVAALPGGAWPQGSYQSYARLVARFPHSALVGRQPMESGWGARGAIIEDLVKMQRNMHFNSADFVVNIW